MVVIAEHRAVNHNYFKAYQMVYIFISLYVLLT